MDLTFEKQENKYVAEFEATADFNLHIEGVVEGNIKVYQRTAGGEYAYIRAATPYPSFSDIYDYDFVGVVYPKYIKVVSEVQPSLAVVTSDGETTQIGGGNSMIEFSVNGTTYQAEEGMTWTGFVQSEYNDGVFELTGYYVAHDGRYLVNSDTFKRVSPADTIIVGHDYLYYEK